MKKSFSLAQVFLFIKRNAFTLGLVIGFTGVGLLLLAPQSPINIRSALVPSRSRAIVIDYFDNKISTATKEIRHLQTQMRLDNLSAPNPSQQQLSKLETDFRTLSETIEERDRVLRDIDQGDREFRQEIFFGAAGLFAALITLVGAIFVIRQKDASIVGGNQYIIERAVVQSADRNADALMLVPSGRDDTRSEELRIFDRFRERMRDERDRIRSSSRANLLFGLAFSIIALIILGYPLFGDIVSSGKLTATDFYSYFTQRAIPRLSVGFLIQVVGFFFLRLYVTNEMDIKHTKNESTNFDAWMIAVVVGQRDGWEKARPDVLKRLSTTERNFVLKKGEKSVGIENDAQYNDITASLQEILQRLRPEDS